MMGGIHGRILHVDLTTGQTRVETPPEELFRLLVGGRALVAYLLLRDLPPHTEPLGPANIPAGEVPQRPGHVSRERVHIGAGPSDRPEH